jgi:CRP-like cAMP-binding protein
MLNISKNKNSSYASGNLPLNLNISPKTVGKPVREPALNKWKRPSCEISIIGDVVHNRVLSSLPDSDFARLLPHLQTVTLSSGENIFQPDASGTFVYFPGSAVFSQLNFLEDGRTVETAMIGNEGIVGISVILSSRHNVAPWTQTLLGGNAYRINTAIFKQEFNGCGFLQTSLLEYLNLYIKQISQRVVCNNHHIIEERFSTWLLMLDDRCGKNKLVLTHEQIAQMLGVHRPSITCIAQDLRNKGIINYIRGRISILNRKKLEESACECYSVINHKSN